MGETVATLRLLGKGLRALLLPAVCSSVAAAAEMGMMASLVPFLSLLMGGGGPGGPQLGFGRWAALPLPTPFGDSDAGRILVLAALFLALLTVRVIAEYLGAVLTTAAVQEAVGDMRVKLFTRFVGYGKAFYDDVGVARISSLLCYDVFELGNVAMSAKMALNNLMLSVGYVALLFAISWRLFLVVVAIYPVFRWLSVHANRRVAAAAKIHDGEIVRLNDLTGDAVSSLPIIKAFNAEDGEIAAFARATQGLVASYKRIEADLARLTGLQELVVPVVILVMITLLVHVQVLRFSGANAELLVFFVALRRIGSAMGGLFVAIAGMRKAGPLLAKFTRHVEEPVATYTVPSGAVPCPPLTDSIAVRDLAFTYVDGTVALKGVSFDLKQGWKTALVGTTGSGKSSIVNALLRLYDVPPGTILYDGRDIRDFDARSLRRRIGVVTQENYVRNDTLRANLLLGQEQPLPDEQLYAALHAVRLGPLLGRLGAGLDSRLGARGTGLSGGERQRLSIARLLLRSPEILVMDEATSALDRETEDLVNDALRAFVAGRTCIVVAHRLATVADADWVIVLGGGVVVEQGPFAELVARGGAFADSVERQRVAR